MKREGLKRSAWLKTLVETKENREIEVMFQKIAPRYDRLNALLSFGLHTSWRAALSARLPPRGRLLDCCCGTGDQLLSAQKASPAIFGIGLDRSEAMLFTARRKKRAKGPPYFVRADATALPFPGASFDAVSISFGIRNISDIPSFLREAHRVLKPQGKLLILELASPSHPLLKIPYRLYLRRLLPLLARACSPHPLAYHYLAESIQHFLSPKEILSLLEKRGFSQGKARALTAGTVTLYTAKKDS